MKEKRKHRKALLRILVIACLGILGYSLFQMAGIRREYRHGVQEYEQLRRSVQKAKLPEERKSTDPAFSGDEARQPVSLQDLKEGNPDVIAWIEIPDTAVSYPVMHGRDNIYYLEHTFSGQKNSAGSIFMEALNAGDFLDLHTIIYGHNMKNGAMFGSLKEYRNPDYLKAHPLIYLDLEEESRVYEIFSCHEVPADSDVYTIGFVQNELYREFLDNLKEGSDYDTGVLVSGEEQVITLSSCTTDEATRFVVHAKRIK